MFLAENIPSELKSSPSWINWISVPIPNHKPLKKPNPAKWKDRHSPWINVVDNNQGVGFIYTPHTNQNEVQAHNFICFDLDDQSEENKTLISELRSYTEISPSGTGFHVIVQTATQQDKQRVLHSPALQGKGVVHRTTLKRDLFVASGYVTVTGNILTTDPAHSIIRTMGCTELIDIIQRYFFEASSILRNTYNKEYNKQRTPTFSTLSTQQLRTYLNLIPVQTLESDIFDRMSAGQPIKLNAFCTDEARLPWLIIGLALHDHTNGSAKGFALWDTWSQQGNKYNIDAIHSAWSSFSTRQERQQPQHQLQDLDPEFYPSLDQEYQEDIDQLPTITIGSLIALAKAQQITFPHLNDKALAIPHIKNFQAYVAHTGLQFCINEITKTQCVEVPSELQDHWNLGAKVSTLDKAITCIHSDLQLERVEKTKWTHALISRFASIQCYETLINPVRDYFEKCGSTYDLNENHDYVQDLMGTIIADLDYTQYAQTYKVFLRKWLIQVVAAACTPEDTMARLNRVLILVGPQGIGKTKWVSSLFPQEIRQYCSADKELRLSKFKSDSTKLAMELSSTLICNINEIDRVFDSANYADFKAFLDQTDDSLVLPYGREPVSMKRRTVFIGSCNTERFLRDPTGNRRVEVLHVDRLIADHRLNLDGLWGQVYHLYENGYTWWLDTDDPDDHLAIAHRDKINNKLMTTLDSGYAEVLEETFDSSRPLHEWQELELRDLKAILGIDLAKKPGATKLFKGALTAWMKVQPHYTTPIQYHAPRGATFYRVPPLRDKSTYTPFRLLGAEKEKATPPPPIQ